MSTLLSRFRRPAPVEKGTSPYVVPEGFTPITQFLPEDIVIVGCPRSGNTWLEYLVLGVVYGVDPRWVPHGLAQELVPYLAFPGDKYFPRKSYRRYATRRSSSRILFRARNAAGLCTCCGMGATYWFPTATIARRSMAWNTTF